MLDPPSGHRRLPGPGARGRRRARRSGSLLTRRTGAGAAEAELAEAAAGLADGRPGGRAPLRGGPRAVQRAGRGRPRRPDRRGPRRPRARRRRWPTGRGRHPVGWPGAKVALAAIELSRFDITLLDEPTNDLDFEGLGRSRRGCGRGGAAWSSSPTTGTSSTDGDHGARARRARPARPREFGGGWAGLPGGAGQRPPPCRRGLRASTTASAGRARGPGRAPAPVGHHRGPPGDAQPAGQRQGPARLPDQPHREAGVQGPPDRAGPGRPRGGGEAVGGVGPPLHHRGGGPGRRGGGPADRGGDRAGHVPPRARSTSRSTGASGWP